jgi:hypothetical protein
MLARVRRRIIGAIAALAGVLLVGVVLLGGSEDSEDDPQPITGPGRQVANVVTRLERATRRRRFDVVCDELFTRAARTRAGGRNCVRLLRSTARDVRRPRIRLLSVRIDGRRAEARVRTLSEGQAAVEETIDFLRERGRYRIASLRG